MTWRKAVAGLTIVLVGAAAAPAAAPDQAAASAGCRTVLPAGLADELAARYPGIEATVAVYETDTRCWHHLNQGMQLTTASVIKAQVLGAVLLAAQDGGRHLTSWERSQIAPMIQYSFNPETSALYQHLGGAGGVAATDPRFGATATSHTATFGLTRSTAVDRTNVALRLLHGGGDLRRAGRAEAWGYMSHVHPLQQWGITAGVPSGWSVALKNGFYPARGIGWRVGSSGFVRRDDADHGYAITIMTQGAGDQATGVQLVEDVSRRVASELTIGPGRSRPIDRARCVLTSSGESWSGVATRLGLPADRWPEVRTVAGGNTSPLSGQRACSTVIPPEPRQPGSTVNGSYQPIVTDLDCDGHDDLLWYGPGAGRDVLWRGGADRRFAPRSVSVSGHYIARSGDFDGDGCGDVLWYAPDTDADFVWYGGPQVDSRQVVVDGRGYAPEVGDLDGDGADDVLWHAAGTERDVIWHGSPARRFASRTITVLGAYDPVVADLEGDGADDIIWYAAGGSSDPVWFGRPGQRSEPVRSSTSVVGRYRPGAADVDGDGTDEVLWYSPGSATDVRWDGAPPDHTSSTLVIDGDHLPLAGDFDGDGVDDIAWYGPGGLRDAVWWGSTSGFTSTALAVR